MHILRHNSINAAVSLSQHIQQLSEANERMLSKHRLNIGIGFSILLHALLLPIVLRQPDIPPPSLPPPMVVHLNRTTPTPAVEPQPAPQPVPKPRNTPRQDNIIALNK